MTDGAFNPRARDAISTAGLGRCVGCGRTPVTMQHRRPRGMGGTSNVSIGHPANGVPLCGDGVRGCHGWAEKHRADARLLGWLLGPRESALGSPWWNRSYRGWVRWIEDEGLPHIELRHPDLGDLGDQDETAARLAALARFNLDRPSEPPPSPKAIR